LNPQQECLQKFKNEKMKKKILLSLNILALPILLAIYFLDRILILPLVWIEGLSLQEWAGNTKKMEFSAYRVVAALVVYLFIKLIVWIF
jgi:hypothetical protein